MTLMSKLSTSFVIVVSLLSSAQPLSENMAEMLSVGGGVVIGGAAGAGTYYIADNYTHNNTYKLIAGGIVGGGVGYLSYSGLHSWLYGKTPTARIAAAKAIVFAAAQTLEQIEQNLTTSFNDRVVKKNFDNDALFIAHVNARFGTSWPLVRAREFLLAIPRDARNSVDSLHRLAESAREPLDLAMNEMRSSGGYISLKHDGDSIVSAIKSIQNKCVELKNNDIVQLAALVEIPLVTIVQQDNFAFQVELYEKHVEAERQRRHAEEEAARRRQHELEMQQNALAVERARVQIEGTKVALDHVDRHVEREHESAENRRKRQHQRDVLRENRGRDVTLNVG